MTQDTDRPAGKAVELNDSALDKAQGGFTPTSGADKMEFSSPDNQVPASGFTPNTGADKMEFSSRDGSAWLF